MKYELRYFESTSEHRPCEDCHSVVPVNEFSCHMKVKLLCEFCANVLGDRDSPATKQTVCAAMNVLLEKLTSKKKGSK